MIEKYSFPIGGGNEKKYIADVLYEEIYDPWTEDCTTESIMKDMQKKPLEIMYSLCARLKECLGDIKELENKLEEERNKEKNYEVSINYNTWCLAKTKTEAIEIAIKKYKKAMQVDNFINQLNIKINREIK